MYKWKTFLSSDQDWNWYLFSHMWLLCLSLIFISRRGFSIQSQYQKSYMIENQNSSSKHAKLSLQYRLICTVKFLSEIVLLPLETIRYWIRRIQDETAFTPCNPFEIQREISHPFCLLLFDKKAILTIRKSSFGSSGFHFSY